MRKKLSCALDHIVVWTELIGCSVEVFYCKMCEIPVCVLCEIGNTDTGNLQILSGILSSPRALESGNGYAHTKVIL